jgi:hypothetical protein
VFRISETGSTALISESLLTIFWVKKAIIFCQLVKKILRTCSNVKTGETINFSHYLFVIVLPEIWDQGSGTEKNQDGASGINIPDRNTGYGTGVHLNNLSSGSVRSDPYNIFLSVCYC